MKTSITDEEIQYTNIIGIPTKKAMVKKIEDEKKNVVYFDKNEVLRNIDSFVNDVSRQCTTDDDLKGYGINSTIVKFKEAMEKLKKYVSSIDDLALQNIIENAPRLKNGNIRNAKLPLYLTGLTLYEGEQGCWARVTSIEASLIPVEKYSPIISPSSIFASPTKEPNTFNIEFTTSEREYNKIDIPIVDENFNYNKVSYSRNSYLKAEDLIIGNIYKDAKDKEFLYLGSVVISHSSNKYKALEYDIDDVSMKNEEKPYSYVFVKLSDKVKKTKTLGLSFKDWFSPILTKQMMKKGLYPDEFDDTAFFNLFKIAKSFKVVEDLGPFFTKSEMKCDIDIKTTDKLGNEYRVTMKVPVVGSKMIYCVYANSGYRSNRPILYKSFDKKSADEYVKKLKKNHIYVEDFYAPVKYKSRYFAETIYCHKTIGYSDDIAKIDDIFKKFETTKCAIDWSTKHSREDIKKQRCTPREELFPAENESD